MRCCRLFACSLFLVAACGSKPDNDNANGDEFTVAVEPRQVEIPVGTKQHFTATVKGLDDQTVLWSVLDPNGGTVDSSGVYTAPEIVGGLAYVIATSVADPSIRGAATVVVGEAQVVEIAVGLEPLTADLGPGATQQFTATVTGTEDHSLTWSVTPEGGGTVDGDGLYTAPAGAGTYTVTATSVADPSKRASATVTVTVIIPPVVTVTVDPEDVRLATGATRRFQATVTGSANTAVNWSVREGGGGTIDGSGLYTAPNKPGTFTVVATSAADPTKSDTATITVVEEIVVRVEPQSVQLFFDGEQQFQATVSGSANTDVTWTVKEAGGGTVSTSGAYTAPAVLGTYSVVATSVADPTRSGQGTAIVNGPAPVDRRIVPLDRRVSWSPGIPGGIPEVTTVHTTIDAKFADGATDATKAINDALDAAGRVAAQTGIRQVVFLPAGTYKTSAAVSLKRSGVVLRGAGKGKTILYQTTPGRTSVSIGSDGNDFRTTPVVDVVGSVVKGATSITVTDASGIKAGDVLQLDQVEDGDMRGTFGFVWRFDIWWSMRGSYALRPNSGLESKFPDSPDGARPIAQQVEVAAKEGNVLTLSSPVHIDFPSAQHPQVWRSAGAGQEMTKFSGVEDMTIRGTMNNGDGHDMILMRAAAYCWVKNVESDGLAGSFTGRHLQLFNNTYRCVVRDSYFHHTINYNPGGNGYGVTYSGSDTLIENNVMFALNKPLFGETSGGGNVIAYNYVDEAVLGSLTGTWQETGADSSHGSFCHSDLFEGNLAPNLSTDATHGNNGWITFFRNHATGQNSSALTTGNLRAVEVAGRNREHTSIGNVLLTPITAVGAILFSTPDNPKLGPAVYRIGTNTWDKNGKMFFGAWDEGQALALFERHLDYDYVTKSVYDDPDNPVKELPASLYLPQKPAFFGDLEWPWVDPMGATDGERVKTLPAKARFDAGKP